MISKIREKWIPILLGIFLVGVSLFLFRMQPTFLQNFLYFLDNKLYDTTNQLFYKPLKKEVPITIVDIDDESIAKEGRWPWSRKKMGQLLDILREKKALVVGLDIIFAEAEENIIETIEKELQEEGSQLPLIDQLKEKKKMFDYDQFFANSLSKIDSVLGFVLNNSSQAIGLLPKPILTLTKEEEKLLIPNYTSYLSNIPLFQNSAAAGGFINASMDSDGIIRHSYLVLRYGDKLYASLSLAAISLYLLEEKIQLEVGRYGDQSVLEGIRLGNTFIPTDPWGRVLIPFRGPPYSFPYVSATDLLQKKAPDELFSNRLIFIGSSAAGKDLFTTSISPVYPGVEIHASMAAGIIDQYFPSSPAWGKGVSFLLILGVGLIAAILMPFCGPILSLLVFLILLSGLFSLEIWIWLRYSLFFSVSAPTITLFLLFLFEEIYGYFFETRKKKEIRDIFGQYVPNEHIDRMLKKRDGFDMEGENKELSVLFSDIRGFTSISEQFSAKEIKQLLNEYLTPMTQVIFEHNGTIDKYVGDMIMAFWGAPLEDPDHALHAAEAALAMQEKLSELNTRFEKEKKITVQIGVGISSGMMNVGDMGSKFRRAYTVLGDTVNLGSRLESLTKFYHVKNIVSYSTWEKTQEAFVYRKLDKVQVKGKKEPTEIFELISKKDRMDSSLQEELDLHHQGLELYWQRDWNGAEKIFSDLAKRFSHYKELYELYLERVSAMKQNPPGNDWSGVFILESK